MQTRSTGRLLSVLLLAALLVSLFSGLTFTAEAASYKYNSGKRGEVCTALSADAKAYYTGSYTYEKLSALTASNLRSTLRTLVRSDYKTVGYNGLKTYFKYTDAYQGSTSTLLLFYCSGTTSSAWDGAATWNREHMWPDSKGGSAMEGDLSAMRPTDPNVNSKRGNYPYGKVSGGSAANANAANGNKLGGYVGGGYFEPLDNVKGDVARVVLYDYMMNDNAYITTLIQSEDLLLEWLEADPVDTYEMSRNDSVESIQGSRNPFIDYPEYGWLILGREIPTGITTPSGSSGEVCNHNWVEIGRTNATCTTDGSIQYRCSLCQRTKTDTISAPGHQFVNGVCTVCGAAMGGNVYTLTSSLSVGDEVILYNAGNKMALPAVTKGSYYLDGVSITPTGSTITTDDASIVWTVGKDSQGNYTFSQGSKVLSAYVSGTHKNISLDATKETGWVLETCNAANSSFYIYNATLESSYGHVYIEWYPSYSEFTVYDTGASKLSETNFGFQFFKKGGSAEPCSHTWNAGTITTAATCTTAGVRTYTCTKCGETKTEAIDALGHDMVTDAAAVPATCTETGLTEGSHCSRCDYVVAPTVTSALGHDYQETVVAATEEAGGYTEHTCSRCGDSYRDNETDPLACPSKDFTDVDTTKWYHEGVDFMLTNGYMAGTGDGTTFSPNAALTREMLAQILYAKAGKPEVTLTGRFTDVDADRWYAKAVEWAAEKGYVAGYPDGRFGVGDAVTREQLAVILYAYAEKPDADAAVLDGFADREAVSGWAANAMAWAVENGLISGTGSGLLAPKTEASRAQFAVIFRAYLTK